MTPPERAGETGAGRVRECKCCGYRGVMGDPDYAGYGHCPRCGAAVRVSLRYGEVA